MIRRILVAACLHLDRLHLLWGLREIDQRHPDVAHIMARIATREQKLQALRCWCSRA